MRCPGQQMRLSKMDALGIEKCIPYRFQTAFKGQVNEVIDNVMRRQVRLGEKEALDSTLRWFEERFDRIASLEFYQVHLSLSGWHTAITFLP